MTRPAAARVLAAAAVCALAAGCGSASAGPSQPAGAGHTSAPADGPSVPAQSGQAASAHKGHAAPALEAMLPRRLGGVALNRASTTGKAIFAEFGGTAWAQQMTRYLASVGKTPADLYYAQAWDPSGALGLDAGVFQATGVSAASLRKAIINSSRPDSPGLSVSDTSLSGKHVTVVVNQASGTTLYLYDHRDDVFYTGGSGPGTAAQFLGQLP
jgi:hypothetical protein